MWGRSKKEALNYVKDRVLSWIQTWKNSTLTPVGKEVLLKAVATAIPVYPMTCFKFPKALCNELNSMFATF